MLTKKELELLKGKPIKGKDLMKELIGIVSFDKVVNFGKIVLPEIKNRFGGVK